MKKFVLVLICLLNANVIYADTFWDVLVSNKLGVGTTAPLASVHIGAAPQWSWASDLPSLLQINSPPTSHALVIASSSNGTDGGLVIKPSYSNGVASIQGSNSYLNSVANLAINPEGGNLGVGTTLPAAQLHVFRDMLIGPKEPFTYAPTTFQINAVPGENAFVVGSTVSGSDGGVVIKANWGAGVGSIQGTNSYLTAVANLAINPEGGSVGIGTTTPNAKLQVAGSISIGSSAPQSNKALCWTSSRVIGYCSSAIDQSGGCTCNAIQ